MTKMYSFEAHGLFNTVETKVYAKKPQYRDTLFTYLSGKTDIRNHINQAINLVQYTLKK